MRLPFPSIDSDGDANPTVSLHSFLSFLIVIDTKNSSNSRQYIIEELTLGEISTEFRDCIWVVNFMLFLKMKSSIFSLLLRFALIGILILPAMYCTYEEDVTNNSIYGQLCHTLGSCNGSNGSTRFAMIGDSWTDLMGGVRITRTFREFLEEQYGFKISGSTMAGQRMEVILDTGLHFKVIEEAGPELRYMLLSLGGNDLIIQDATRFNIDPEGEKTIKLDEIETILRKIVYSGNNYKVSLWGGSH